MNTKEQPVRVQRETAHSFPAGMTYLSCPVFGRPDAVAARKCIMVLSGPEAAKAKVRPLLEPLGRAVLGRVLSAAQEPFVAVC
jgi:3-hydroxyisobutyrate dehydrogenase-like beta-hydroxyacid dehydrogenase